MKDEREQLREYFDSVEMTEDFRRKLLALPGAQKASPKAAPPRRNWKALAAAALLALVCLAGLPLLRFREPLSPAAPETRDVLPTQWETVPSTNDPGPGTELTGAAATGAIETEAAPSETDPMTEPPLPPDTDVPTEPGEDPGPTPPATEPRTPATQPPAPVTEPPAPVTEPPAPVTEPPVPVTEPPAPVTEPPAPVTEPPAPVTEPPAPVTEPPATEPSEPDTGPPDFNMPGAAEDAIPAEDLGWSWTLQRSEAGDLLLITNDAGALCTLDLTGRLTEQQATGRDWIFDREWTYWLCLDWDGVWRLYVEA